MLQPNVDSFGGEQLATEPTNGCVVDDLAVIDDDGPIGNMFDVGNVMARQEDRRVEIFVELYEKISKSLLRKEIEANRWFVEDQQVRSMQHACRQLATHPLTQRLSSHGLIEQLDRSELFAEFLDATFGLRFIEPEDRPQHSVGDPRSELLPEQ